MRGYDFDDIKTRNGFIRILQNSKPDVVIMRLISSVWAVQKTVRNWLSIEFALQTSCSHGGAHFKHIVNSHMVSNEIRRGNWGGNINDISSKGISEEKELNEEGLRLIGNLSLGNNFEENVKIMNEAKISSENCHDKDLEIAFDDVNGKRLNVKEVKIARIKELEYFTKMGVYKAVPRGVGSAWGRHRLELGGWTMIREQVRLIITEAG